jgi:uncharacterized protein YigA (DUF484 family)
MRQRGTDLPLPAHEKAVAALDEFDATAAEYVALLDTQRALLGQGNADAVAASVARGDALALRAAACGRRLAPIREALASAGIRGPRAESVRRRLERMAHRAALLGAAAADVAARCERERVAIGSELTQLQNPAGGGRAGAYRYPPPARPAVTIDTRG